MRNFGDGESQIVEFLPAFPNQGAFLIRIIPPGGPGIGAPEQNRFDECALCFTSRLLPAPRVV